MNKKNKIHFWSHATFIQWFSTITFILCLIFSHNSNYGYMDDFEVVITLPQIVAFISIIIAQAYVYAIYISGTPLVVGIVGVIASALLELLFSILLVKIGIFTPDIIALLKFYGVFFIQLIFIGITYYRVEYVEIKAEDLQNLENGQLFIGQEIEDYSKFY